MSQTVSEDSSARRALEPADETAPVFLVLVNVPDAAVADAIESALLDARLAACVNRFGPVRSAYVWQDKREVASEIALLIKTVPACWDALHRRVRDLHPYEVPEIIAWEADASAAYARWVRDNTHSG